MKTETLIRALAADAARPVIAIERSIRTALFAGAAGSLALFVMLLRPRADFMEALHGFELPMKLAFVGCLAFTAARALAGAARPTTRRLTSRALGISPLVLLLAVLLELVTAPPESWLVRLGGRNVTHCLALIPMLSVLPGVFLFLALRRGAPARPGLAGAIAGLTAGAIGACLYALSCPEDSPLFVATWYPLAIASVTAVSFLVGRRWLRW